MRDNEMEEAAKKKLGIVNDNMNSLITEIKRPARLFTQNNLMLLVECWNECAMWTKGTDYLHYVFPEWSFMISQFQIFVLEYEMKEMREHVRITAEVAGVTLPKARQNARMSELLEQMRVV
jgi:hypothetical protein